MTYVVGQAITEGFSTGLEGEDFTVDKSRDPNGDTFTPTFTDLSDGDYTIGFTPDAAGAWYARWTGNTSGEEYSTTWHVVTAQQADPVQYLGGASVEVVSPVSANGDVVSLFSGDDYLSADGRALEWDFVNEVDLTGATVTLTLRYRGNALAVNATVSNAGATTQTVSADLTSTQTSALHNGTYAISAALAGGSSVTLTRGKLRVTSR